MRILRHLSAGVAILCLASGLNAQAPGWKSYSYPADGFRISFPAEPGRQDINGLHIYSVKLEPSWYAATSAVYEAASAGKDPDQTNNEEEKTFLKAVEGHLIKDSQIKLNGYPGLEFESESNNAHFSGRIYRVGEMCFMAVVGYRLGGESADTARFLDSFELIAKVPQ